MNLIKQTLQHGDTISASSCREVEDLAMLSRGTIREKKLNCVQRGPHHSLVKRIKAVSVRNVRVGAMGKIPSQNRFVIEKDTS